MAPITVVMAFEPGVHALAEQLASSSMVETVVLVSEDDSLSDASTVATAKIRILNGSFFSGELVNNLLNELSTDYLLVVQPGADLLLGQRTLETMVQIAGDSRAGVVFSDFRDEVNGQITEHPLIDYQTGSIRDSFDFGSLMLIPQEQASDANTADVEFRRALRFGGWYDLRLRLAHSSSILRIPEPLYSRVPQDRRASGERQFDYVDPRMREYQIEMEQIATRHLKRIGAYLKPRFETLGRASTKFPVRASIVIPVRNRERTIEDAVASALSQKMSFQFNVIVVDNHSTDKTTQILTDLAAQDSRLVHLVPTRNDLGIGGCWNEAVYSEDCGEYAVQLDSDDLYSDENTLAKIVACFDEGGYAMVIGSYSIVNFDLREIPPGLIDHKEWTADNGRNNALRINGLGAPRAFYVPALREIGFPNVSYGEDYSVALRLSRRFQIGRIYESIYFARRWEGNSDASLSVSTANRYDWYKDHVRTIEILARQSINRNGLDKADYQ